MRHGNKRNNLSRKKGHRDALMKNMSISLIEHKRVHTTLAKAKSLRQYIEPLVTKSKNNTQHSRRVVFSYLQNKGAVTELFTEIAGRIGDRPGGYTRIIKTGFRQGDGAETAMIEFVDYNDIYTAGSTGTTKRTRRSRRSRGASTSTNVAPAAAASTSSSSEEE